MLTDDHARRLQEVFLEELSEHLEAWGDALDVLERGEEGHEAPLRAMFRAVHSLKGAASLVGVEALTHACHELESFLAGLREQGSAPEAHSLALLSEAGDLIEESSRRFGDGPATEALGRLLEQLAAPRTSTPRPTEAPEAIIKGARSGAREVLKRDIGLSLARLDALTDLDSELSSQGRVLDAVVESLGESRSELSWVRLEMARLRGLLGGVSKAVEGDASTGRQVAEAMAAAGQISERLGRLSRGLDDGLEGSRRHKSAMARTSRDLADEVNRARMVPFARACRGLDKVVQDLAVRQGKQVTLVIGGRRQELDRALTSALVGVLRHLVRNAIDHGLEPPEDRLAAGKPAEANVEVRAEIRGERCLIRVRDDGRGLDLEAIRARFLEMGIAPPEDPETLALSIFEPGFTTARALTEISGRGVGLDVVRTRIESLRGTVRVSSQPGVGTTFEILVPVSLSVIQALFVRSHGQRLALPIDHLSALERLSPERLRESQGLLEAHIGGEWVAAAPLGELLEGGTPAPQDAAPRCAVALIGPPEVVVLVESFERVREVYVRPLGMLGVLEHLGGGVILPEGDLVFLLQPSVLARLVGERQPIPTEPAPAVEARRVLVVDDSATARAHLSGLLAQAGHHPAMARDGVEALRWVRREGVEIVVSDVEMPRLDGVALARRLKETGLPVILLSGLDEGRLAQLTVECGADAWLSKRGFEPQRLLDLIASLTRS